MHLNRVSWTKYVDLPWSTHSYGTWPCRLLMYIPIKNCDFHIFHNHGKFLEGKHPQMGQWSRQNHGKHVYKHETVEYVMEKLWYWWRRRDVFQGYEQYACDPWKHAWWYRITCSNHEQECVWYCITYIKNGGTIWVCPSKAWVPDPMIIWSSVTYSSVWNNNYPLVINWQWTIP